MDGKHDSVRMLSLLMTYIGMWMHPCSYLSLDLNRHGSINYEKPSSSHLSRHYTLPLVFWFPISSSISFIHTSIFYLSLAITMVQTRAATAPKPQHPDLDDYFTQEPCDKWSLHRFASHIGEVPDLLGLWNESLSSISACSKKCCSAAAISRAKELIMKMQEIQVCPI